MDDYQMIYQPVDIPRTGMQQHIRWLSQTLYSYAWTQFRFPSADHWQETVGDMIVHKLPITFPSLWIFIITNDEVTPNGLDYGPEMSPTNGADNEEGVLKMQRIEQIIVYPAGFARSDGPVASPNEAGTSSEDVDEIKSA